MLEQGRPDSAMVHFSALEVLLENKLNRDDAHLIFSGLCSAASKLCARYGNYAQAYQYVLSAEETAHQYGFYDVLAASSSIMSSISNLYRDRESTLLYARSSFRNALKIHADDQALESFSNLLIVMLSTNTGPSETAGEINLFRRSKIPETSHRRFTDALLDATLAWNAKDYVRAQSALDAAMTHIDDSWQSARARAIVLSLKSKLAMEARDYGEAIRLTRLYSSLPEIAGNPDVEFDAIQTLAKAYRETGNRDSASFYTNRYVNMADTLFAPSAYGNLRDMKATRDLNKAQEEYRVLEYRSKFIRTGLWAALGVIVVISVLLWLISRQKRALDRRNTELYNR